MRNQTDQDTNTSYKISISDIPRTYFELYFYNSTNNNYNLIIRGDEECPLCNSIITLIKNNELEVVKTNIVYTKNPHGDKSLPLKTPVAKRDYFISNNDNSKIEKLLLDRF